ncbi:MAG: lysophospholipid acyltransferase family protein [Myxococcota bacterium]
MTEHRSSGEHPLIDVGADVDEEAADELYGALDGLRAEIRSRFPVPARPSPLAAPRDDWERWVEAARRRLGTLGMTERSANVDEFGMDDVVLNRTRPLLDWLFDRYWRVDLRGLDHLPSRGPCLMVANRSGLLPYDGLMLAHAIERMHPSGERPRFLVADWLIHLPFVHASLAQLGGVRACRENAARLLSSARFLVAFPEGEKGAAKTFRERYELKRFGRGGAVRVALEQGVPLVPVGIVGPEEAHPILFKVGPAARAVGLPFLPVTPTFPFLGPLGLLPLPTKWVIRIGQPMPLDHLEPDAARDDLLVARLTEEIRTRVQVLINAALGDRDSVWG